MAIRIDPGLALVWRDPSTVQLGLDPPRAVVPVPTTEQERFLCGLREPVERDDLPALAERAGCGPGVAAGVLGAAAAAMVDDPEPAVHRVEVLGAGPVADTVCLMLQGEGVAVVRSSPPRDGVVLLPDPVPTFAVLVADHVVDPPVRAAWARRPVPHLPVLVGDGRVRIGPVLGAGGPCLQCLDLHRVDEDELWPVLAAQAWARPAPDLGALRTAAVAVHVVQRVLARLAGPGRSTRRSGPDDDELGAAALVLVDRADLSVSARPLRRHPRCACGALPGSDSGPGLPRGTIPDATT